MDINQALQAMRNLGVSLNDYDTEAKDVLCDFVEKALAAKAAPSDSQTAEPTR